jgi:hypothetical protein
MMRVRAQRLALVAAIAVALLLLLLPAAGSTASGAAARRCETADHVVKEWRDLVVTRSPAPGLRTTACWKPTGQRAALDDGDALASAPWAHAGRWVGFTVFAGDDTSDVVAVDNQAYDVQGRVIHRLSTTGTKSVKPSGMVLKANGSFAVVGTLLADGHYRVQRYDRDGPKVLATYASTVPKDLRLHGGTISWTVAGHVHRARLR